MARGKYKADYRLTETLDERGRIRTAYEYAGAAYRYRAGGDVAVKRLRLLTLIVLLGWVAFIWGFVPYSALSTALYISLPRAFCALPLMMIADTVVSAFTWKEPLERRMADKLNERLPSSGALLAVLSVSTCVLGTVFLVTRGEITSGDVQLYLSTAVMAVCGAAVIRLKIEAEVCDA